jgi:hypothetical protein
VTFNEALGQRTVWLGTPYLRCPQAAAAFTMKTASRAGRLRAAPAADFIIELLNAVERCD